MKKRVVIVNDELGTMALGFSKAGYDVSAIYIEQRNTNAIRVLRENWGDVVRTVDLDVFNCQETVTDLDAEFVAGKIFGGFSVAGSRRETISENRVALQAVCLLKEKRPKCFLFKIKCGYI